MESVEEMTNQSESVSAVNAEYSDNGPIISKEDELFIENLYAAHPEIQNKETPTELKMINEKSGLKWTIATDKFDPDQPWFQTYSGIRFTTLKPDPEQIVIQDIARGLAMQCRYYGQVKKFYSIAQHCVLVSYICDYKDRLHGLMHDATEAYIGDFNNILKHSGVFDNYKEMEQRLWEAICVRFNMDKEEPASVKIADKVLLATEGRDVLTMVRPDWFKREKPLPFKIEPLGPEEAELLFLNRFYELI